MGYIYLNPKKIRIELLLAEANQVDQRRIGEKFDRYLKILEGIGEERVKDNLEYIEGIHQTLYTEFCNLSQNNLLKARKVESKLRDFLKEDFGNVLSDFGNNRFYSPTPVGYPIN